MEVLVNGSRRDETVDSLPTRQSLLGRLRNWGDSDSWRVFFDTYWRLIYNVARKSGLSDDQAQEVVQETVISVARAMPQFKYDAAKGSFKQWLLLICRRRIHDQLRRFYGAREMAQREAEELDGAAENVPAPDLEIAGNWEQEWREQVFQMALARVREQVNPKHYQVFEFCVLQNLGASEVAAMLGLSAARVYLAKHRISSAVKRAAKEIEAELDRETTPSKDQDCASPELTWQMA
jgi:RNA polymerase sigma factor (sigma-70 family)